MTQEKNKQGMGLAAAVIALCLVASVALVASPPPIQGWLFSLGSVIVALVAGIKFAALCIDAFRRNKRLLALLWGILAALFLLLLMGELQKIIVLTR